MLVHQKFQWRVRNPCKQRGSQGVNTVKIAAARGHDAELERLKYTWAAFLHAESFALGKLEAAMGGMIVNWPFAGRITAVAIA